MYVCLRTNLTLVALDAKFMKFTKRQTLASALQVPLRKPEAPLEGTAEEQSLLRRITAQGPDFDKFEKYRKPDRLAQLNMAGVKRVPRVSVIGAYSDQLETVGSNHRDLLYECLAAPQARGDAAQKTGTLEQLRGLDKSAPAEGLQHAKSFDTIDTATTANSAAKGGQSPGEAGTPAVAGVGLGVRGSSRVGSAGGGRASSSGVVVLNVSKRDKIDLVGEHRPRYVDPLLLPSARTLSLVEVLAREQREREARRLRERQGLHRAGGLEAARLEMEAQVQQAGSAVETAGGSGGVADMFADSATGLHQQRAAAERSATMRRMFLRKERVHYGDGRVVSTHSMKGKLEEPWTTAKGRYAPLPGDRTA